MAAQRSSSKKEADIAHEAAAWVARHDRGLTAEEQDRFSQWLADDPRHGDWLARHRETVRGLKALAQWCPEHTARPNPDLLEPPRRARGGVVALAFALAACVALAAGFWWTQWPRATQVAPEIAVHPPATEQRVLEDGSTIDLNRGAAVEVRFTAAERRVRLVKGEALFAVAKNRQRPFIVEAGNIAIRAVGTAFNVNLQPAAVEVLVTEGTVAVDQAPPPPAPESSPAASESSAVAPATLVGAGQRALVSFEAASPPPQVVPVSREEIARLLAWQPRQLEFTDTPLSQVVAEFNRENRLKLVIDDPALAGEPIGASFRSDNVEGFVRLLEASFHVKAERRGDVIVLRRDTAAKR
jgi:transmembrane sensor